MLKVLLTYMYGMTYFCNNGHVFLAVFFLASVNLFLSVESSKTYSRYDRSSRRDKTRQRNQVHSNPAALVTLCSDKYTIRM